MDPQMLRGGAASVGRPDQDELQVAGRGGLILFLRCLVRLARTLLCVQESLSAGLADATPVSCAGEPQARSHQRFGNADMRTVSTRKNSRRGSRRCPARSRRRVAGFSFVEALVLVAVVGMVATLSIPYVMVYIKKTRALEPVELVEDVIEDARVKAARYNNEVVVVFDTDEQKISSFVDQTAGPAGSDPDRVYQDPADWGETTLGAADVLLQEVYLQTSTGLQVAFWEATDDQPPATAALAGTDTFIGDIDLNLTTGANRHVSPGGFPLAVFKPDGTMAYALSVRIGSGPDRLASQSADWDHDRNFFSLDLSLLGARERSKWVPKSDADPGWTAGYYPAVTTARGALWQWF